MKLKIQISEGFHTWILKGPIEIDTDNYPEFSGMNEAEVLKLLNKNSFRIQHKDGDDVTEGWTIYDELMAQEEQHSQEKNYETEIQLAD